MFLGESQSDPENPESEPDPPTVLSDDNANSDQPAGCSCSPFPALGCAPWQSFTAEATPSGPVADPDGPRYITMFALWSFQLRYTAPGKTLG